MKTIVVNTAGQTPSVKVTASTVCAGGQCEHGDAKAPSQPPVWAAPFKNAEDVALESQVQSAKDRTDSVAAKAMTDKLE